MFQAAVVFLLVLLGSTSSSLASDTPSDTTIRFAVTDIVGLEELQTEFGAFQNLLEEKTGYHVEFFPVSSRNIVVEALRSGKVDFVLTGPAEYVVIHKRTNASPIIRFSRPDYFSSIVVMSSSGIDSVADLKGKKVAFGDVGSTSYHLAPMQLLADYGLNPQSDINPIYISKNLGWEALKRGDVVALGIKQSQFELFRDSDKEKEPSDFKVIARGPDLPNDVLVAGNHVETGVAQRLQDTFANNSEELLKAILVGKRNQKYQGMKFIAGVKDEDYNYVRTMYATAGYPEYLEFIEEK